MDDDIPQLISLADQSAIKKQKERETKDISIDSGSIQALSRGLSGVSEAPGTSYPASMRLHLSYIFPFSPSHLSQRRRRKNGWILFCAQVVQPAQRKPEPVIFHFLERSQEIGREEIQIEWTMKHICWEWNAKNWNANVTIQWKWSVPSNHLELQRMGGVTLEIVETQLNTMLEWKIKTKLTFRFKWKPQTIFEFKAYNWDKKLNEIWSWIEQLNLRLKFKKCI